MAHFCVFQEWRELHLARTRDGPEPACALSYGIRHPPVRSSGGAGQQRVVGSVPLLRPEEQVFEGRPAGSGMGASRLGINGPSLFSTV